MTQASVYTTPRQRNAVLKNEEFAKTLREYEEQRKQYLERHKKRFSVKRQRTLALLEELGQGTLPELRERAAARSIELFPNFASYIQQLAREGRLYTFGETTQYITYSVHPIDTKRAASPYLDRAIALVDRSGGGKNVRQLSQIDSSIPNLAVQLSKAVQAGKLHADGTPMVKRYYTPEQWQKYQAGDLTLDIDSLTPLERFDRAIVQMQSEGCVYSVRKLAREFRIYPGFFQRYPDKQAEMDQLRSELEPISIKHQDSIDLDKKALAAIEIVKRDELVLSQAEFCRQFELPSTFFETHLDARKVFADAKKAVLSKQQSIVKPKPAKSSAKSKTKPSQPKTGITVALEPKPEKVTPKLDRPDRALNDTHRAILAVFRWQSVRSTAEILQAMRGGKGKVGDVDRALAELVASGELVQVNRNPTRYKFAKAEAAS